MISMKAILEVKERVWIHKLNAISEMVSRAASKV
jgi:hypothetical protein